MTTPPSPTGPDDAAPPEVPTLRWSAVDQAWVTSPVAPPIDAPPPMRPRFGHPGWVHLLLLVLTLATMTWAGGAFFLNYVSAVGLRRVTMPTSTALVGGLWFSVPALLILGAHELGHYFACRYYRIPASLPYFVPAPGTIIGTLGAIIRMALPRTRNALFDVGIAGPIAGFLMLLPVAWYGVAHSYVVRLSRPLAVEGLAFGEPLLLTLLQRAYFGTTASGDLALLVWHPAAFAAWFGLVATVLNLFPAGQLDGGHIVYAIIGRASRYVTLVALLVVLTLALFVSWSWLLWGVLLVLMVFAFGVDHPPVSGFDEPLGGGRIALALFAVVIFILSFTPAPISPIDFIGAR